VNKLAIKRNLVKPKPATLKRAEKDLHNSKTSRTVKGPAGYTVRNAKGVKIKKSK